MEKEIENLKFQVSSSDLIIPEFEGRLDQLKAENMELLAKIRNNTSEISTEINSRPAVE